jgi:hypothetical protein
MKVEIKNLKERLNEVEEDNENLQETLQKIIIK